LALPREPERLGAWIDVMPFENTLPLVHPTELARAAGERDETGLLHSPGASDSIGNALSAALVAVTVSAKVQGSVGRASAHP